LLAKATQQLRDHFAKQLTRANESAAKRDLVQRLCTMADQCRDDAVGRFACLDMARSLAVQIGDPEEFNRVIDLMGRDYPVDTVRLKAAACAAAWKSWCAFSGAEAVPPACPV
jgi:hypothetical protein